MSRYMEPLMILLNKTNGVNNFQLKKNISHLNHIPINIQAYTEPMHVSQQLWSEWSAILVHENKTSTFSELCP